MIILSRLFLILEISLYYPKETHKIPKETHTNEKEHTRENRTVDLRKGEMEAIVLKGNRYIKEKRQLHISIIVQCHAI